MLRTALAEQRAGEAAYALAKAQAIITGDGKVIDEYRERLAAANERLREAEKAILDAVDGVGIDREGETTDWEHKHRKAIDAALVRGGYG
jgi:hypothetical protein